MNQIKNYIHVSNIDTEGLKNSKEQALLKRELIKTDFEKYTGEIVFNLLAIKYGKCSNCNARMKRYLTDGIKLANSILILKKGDIKLKISSVKYSESATLPQSLIDTDRLLKLLCEKFDKRKYKRSYTMEEAKGLIKEKYIDDYVMWYEGIDTTKELEEKKETGELEEYYSKENEEMLKAFIRDYWQVMKVVPEKESDLEEFKKQSEEIIENMADKGRQRKDLTPIAIASNFVRCKGKLSRKDYSTIYECMKILGLIKAEEDKVRNKDAREKYVNHYCDEARNYGLIVDSFGIQITYGNGEE